MLDAPLVLQTKLEQLDMDDANKFGVSKSNLVA